MDKEFYSLDVAAYIARRCKERGFAYNNTKIQKLLYCCYGVALARGLGRICDEYPRAWPYGPAFPRVFTYIKKNGDISGINSDFAVSATVAQKQVVEDVVGYFAKFTASALTEWSHKFGSPWDVVINGDARVDGMPHIKPWDSYIPDEFIRTYFLKNVLTKESEQSA